jgi:hypothetical protein
MAAELVFKDEAAAEYDRAFAHVTMHFMPFLLRAARVVPGMHVLDIATGTGLSAEAALTAVGPRGHVVAADVSPAWVGPDVPLGAGRRAHGDDRPGARREDTLGGRTYCASTSAANMRHIALARLRG